LQIVGPEKGIKCADEEAGNADISLKFKMHQAVDFNTLVLPHAKGQKQRRQGTQWRQII
jgi:hypothetical protein